MLINSLKTVPGKELLSFMSADTVTVIIMNKPGQ